jgi:hypothetical protein
VALGSRRKVTDPRERSIRIAQSATGAGVLIALGGDIAIIKGRSALSWLEDLGLSARLVRVDGSVTVSGAWPAEGSGGR